MAANRERRSTAGNRLAKVLDDEDDEFYKTTYGGFEEEEEDNDFKSAGEDSNDEVDSDFDDPEEEDGPESEEETGKRQKRKLTRNAYKEPTAKRKKVDTKNKVDGTKEKQERKKKSEAVVNDDIQPRKSSRTATATNSLLFEMKQKAREEVEKNRSKQPKKVQTGVRRMTQEELLAEAEKTEKKNVKSLEKYLELEETRKKNIRGTKRAQMDKSGGTIMYLDTTMGDKEKKEENDKTKDDADSEDTREGVGFLIFSKDECFDKYYSLCKQSPPKAKPKQICPVTGKRARYRDPVTDIPYYDLAAYKIIQEIYEKEAKFSSSGEDFKI